MKMRLRRRHRRLILPPSRQNSLAARGHHGDPRALRAALPRDQYPISQSYSSWYFMALVFQE